MMFCWFYFYLQLLICLSTEYLGHRQRFQFQCCCDELWILDHSNLPSTGMCRSYIIFDWHCPSVFELCGVHNIHKLYRTAVWIACFRHFQQAHISMEDKNGLSNSLHCRMGSAVASYFVLFLRGCRCICCLEDHPIESLLQPLDLLQEIP
jgi:hypothetical protein